MKVTAVILNYNSSNDTKKCLEFLNNQDYKNFNIIVVDNASSAADEQIKLQKICEKFKVKLILNSNNKGFSAGNNVGLKEAVNSGADWCLVINPDVEIKNSSYVSDVMNCINSWPDVAMVGTNVILPNGTKQNPMVEMSAVREIFGWPFNLFLTKLKLNKPLVVQSDTGYCEKLAGCCFFISKEFLLLNNYFDENVFLYCEEPILAKSIALRGKKLLFISELTAYHQHYQTKKGSRSLNMQYFLKSRIYYIENYSGYSAFAKKLAIISLNIQKLLWKVLS